MEDTSQSQGGAQGGNGGAGTGGASGDSSANSSATGDKGQQRTVSAEAYDRVSRDMHKYKEENRNLEKRLSDLESDKLKSTNDYKTLYETEKQKRESAETEKKKLSDWMVQTQAFNAVRDEAVKSGLNQHAMNDLELVDMTGVVVETTSNGRFIVNGAKERVEKLKSERPHWFTQAAAPNVNAGGGSNPNPGAIGAGGKVSVDDVVQAELDWKRGKITRKQYEEKYHTYCKQNPAYAQSAAPPTR